MSLAKVLGGIALGLAVFLCVWHWPKGKPQEEVMLTPVLSPVIQEETVMCEPVAEGISAPITLSAEPREQEDSLPPLVPLSEDVALPPPCDRMAQLFHPYPPTLPIVETVSFSSRAPWVSGRSAYLGDYAAHYRTSKHFISRSLHGIGQYMLDRVSNGAKFNVYRMDKDFEFHLVADLSRLRLWLYYFDKEEGTRVLLKSYPISAGKPEPSRPSGCLTPLGVYMLGKETAVYQENSMGVYRHAPCEMVTVFGKRWIPLSQEIAGCTAPAKGLGLHGLPWTREGEGGVLHELREKIGNYDSEGCIRLLSEDIAEIFSVVVSRPAYLHLVPDFVQAHLPGREVSP